MNHEEYMQQLLLITASAIRANLAGQVVQGMLAGRYKPDDGHKTPSSYARQAVLVADAILSELEARR